MALKTVDMENCSKKERCLFGPNEGLAYIPGDECADNFEFNSDTCDCDSAEGVWYLTCTQRSSSQGTIIEYIPNQENVECRVSQRGVYVTSNELAEGYTVRVTGGATSSFTPNRYEDDPEIFTVGEDVYMNVVPKSPTICGGSTGGCWLEILDGNGDVVPNRGLSSATCECPLNKVEACWGCEIEGYWTFVSS